MSTGGRQVVNNWQNLVNLVKERPLPAHALLFGVWKSLYVCLTTYEYKNICGICSCLSEEFMFQNVVHTVQTSNVVQAEIVRRRPRDNLGTTCRWPLDFLAKSLVISAIYMKFKQINILNFVYMADITSDLAKKSGDHPKTNRVWSPDNFCR